MTCAKIIITGGAFVFVAEDFAVVRFPSYQPVLTSVSKNSATYCFLLLTYSSLTFSKRYTESRGVHCDPLDEIKDFDYVNGWYGTVLRQTNPLIEEHALFTLDGDYTTWNVDPYEVAYFQQALAAVWEQREQVLGPSVPLLDSLAEKGRILCFSTCLTTHDGIAIVDSQRFVDESDVPPIDTWFYLQENFLDAHRPTLSAGFRKALKA
jgi:hypothetical protein